MTDTLIGSRVRIQYDDQNESFARYLPVEGTISRRCTATTGPTDWYLVDLAAPIDYQDNAGSLGQFKQVVIPRVLVRSRWVGVPLGVNMQPSVFLLLVRDDQQVTANPVAMGEFIHVCGRYAGSWQLPPRDTPA